MRILDLSLSLVYFRCTKLRIYLLVLFTSIFSCALVPSFASILSPAAEKSIYIQCEILASLCNKKIIVDVLYYTIPCSLPIIIITTINSICAAFYYTTNLG